MDAMREAPEAHKKGEALPAPPLPSNRLEPFASCRYADASAA
jgi:hypothetical protein